MSKLTNTIKSDLEEVSELLTKLKDADTSKEIVDFTISALEKCLEVKVKAERVKDDFAKDGIATRLDDLTSEVKKALTEIVSSGS